MLHRPVPLRAQAWLDQRGQATAEYALVLLVVALVVAALAAFVRGGGLDGLFAEVVKRLIGGLDLP